MVVVCIPIELLKVGEYCITGWLHIIVVHVQLTGIILPDWNRPLVTHIYKGEGDWKNCNKYCEIDF